MTRKLKVLGRVRDARQKQRDAQAAVASQVEAAERDAEWQREQARHELDELYENAAERLAAANGVNSLLALEEERHLLTHYLDEARLAHEAAVARGNQARAVLREYERMLRTSEKLIEREETGLHKQEQREEQRSTDDFVAGRRTA
jgi:flagellar biosynthesis chaperone FliJ